MAELKVFSTIAMRGAVEVLVPRLEQASGGRCAVTFATAPMLVQRIEAGELADVAILSQAGIDALAKAGKLAPGPAVTLASSVTAIAVKAGAPKPDISTPEALKRTLLAARAIAYTDPAAGGASGVYFAKLIERMGIAAQLKPKTKYPPAGGFSGELLITGEADLAVQQKPELMHVAGTEVVGPLPGDYHVVTTFAAAITVTSKNADHAAKLIKLLQSSEAVAVYQAKGLDTP
jgi:molybdate transport system substrate-binding protein